MPAVSILRETPVIDSFRVDQIRAMFQLAPETTSRREWKVSLPLEKEDWHIGLIVGPSGSGKSTIARELFGPAVVDEFDWPTDRAILDFFPETAGIKDIAILLSSVGFSSPPSWLKPYQVLSTGEKFRAHVARALAENRPLTVIDEFTSVVDRTVAKIGSCAVAKTVRARGQKLVAVSCHSDIVEWLAPDWIYQVDDDRFTLTKGRLRRPPIELKIARVHSDAWHLFKHHHYLTASLHRQVACFVAFYEDQPVAFDAWLPFVGRLPRGQRAMRGSRTVCLPDFQGIGIGSALFSHIAAAWRAVGYRAFSCTSHPAEIARRWRSPLWKLKRKPGRNRADAGAVAKTKARAMGRITASFEFIGPPLPAEEARALLCV